MVDLLPDELVEQADRLAGTLDPHATPSDADIRRSASAAYDALVHAVTDALVDAIDPGPTAADIASMRRYFSHRSLKKIFTWAEQSTPADVIGAAGLVAIVTTDAGLAGVAPVFTALQQRRHDADYDHLAAVTAVDAQALVGDGHLQVARGQPAIRALALVALMYGK